GAEPGRPRRGPGPALAGLRRPRRRRAGLRAGHRSAARCPWRRPPGGRLAGGRVGRADGHRRGPGHREHLGDRRRARPRAPPPRPGGRPARGGRVAAARARRRSAAPGLPRLQRGLGDAAAGHQPAAARAGPRRAAAHGAGRSRPHAAAAAPRAPTARTGYGDERRVIPPFEVLRFTGVPAGADVCVLELEGRFAEAAADRTPDRDRDRARLVVENAERQVETPPVAAATLADGSWRATYALPLSMLAGAVYALAVGRDLLLDLPAPDVETPDGGAADPHVRLAREANELRARLDQAEAAHAAADERAAAAAAALAAESIARAEAEAGREREAARADEAVAARERAEAAVAEAKRAAEERVAARRRPGRHEPPPGGDRDRRRLDRGDRGGVRAGRRGLPRAHPARAAPAPPCRGRAPARRAAAGRRGDRRAQLRAGDGQLELDADARRRRARARPGTAASSGGARARWRSPPPRWSPSSPRRPRRRRRRSRPATGAAWPAGWRGPRARRGTRATAGRRGRPASWPRRTSRRP